MKKEKYELEVNLSSLKSDAKVCNYKATILNADLSFLKKRMHIMDIKDVLKSILSKNEPFIDSIIITGIVNCKKKDDGSVWGPFAAVFEDMNTAIVHYEVCNGCDYEESEEVREMSVDELFNDILSEEEVYICMLLSDDAVYELEFDQSNYYIMTRLDEDKKAQQKLRLTITPDQILFKMNTL